jgi:hypothetical protein
VIWAIIAAIVLIGCGALMVYPTIRFFLTPDKKNNTVFNRNLALQQIRKQNAEMKKRAPSYVEQQEKLQAIRRQDDGAKPIEKD